MIDIQQKSSIFILSGPRNSGKTSICSNLFDNLKNNGIQTTGIISRGKYIDGNKNAIEAINLAENSEMLLASYSPGWDKHYPQREWKFNEDALIWGDAVIRHSVPTEILIIDELGFLEFEKNRGWISAFSTLDNGAYHAAVVTIRPNFVQNFIDRCPHSQVYFIKNKKQVNQICRQLLDELERILVN